MFDRVLRSVRRWLQAFHGNGQPYYLVIKRGTSVAMYLECEMDHMGKYIQAYRWTRNSARATVFLHDQKIRVCNLPEDAQWFPVIEIPLYGKVTPSS